MGMRTGQVFFLYSHSKGNNNDNSLIWDSHGGVHQRWWLFKLSKEVRICEFGKENFSAATIFLPLRFKT